MGKRYRRYILLGVLATLLVIAPILLSSTRASIAQTPPTQISTSQSLEQQGKAFYDAGQFTEAVSTLQQASQQYAAQNDFLRQSIVLGNLALAYQQLSQWTEAAAAIDRSLALLTQLQNDTSNSSESQRLRVLAQVLDTQGTLSLARGRAEQALETWERSAVIHEQVGNQTGQIRSQINQAQALQTIGLYRRAADLLTALRPQLQALPDSTLKAAGLRSLGDALAIVDSLADARNTLEESLTIAQRINDSESIAAAWLSLGNLSRTDGEWEKALEFYKQAATVSSLTGTQAQINRLSLLIDQQQWTDIAPLLPQINAQLDRAPLPAALRDRLLQNRSTLYAQINYAQSLIHLAASPTFLPAPSLLQEAEQRMEMARQQAEAIGDRQAESYAAGTLGRVYEISQQASNSAGGEGLRRAEAFTQQALQLSQSIRQNEISYRWQWQLGRIYQSEQQTQKAIDAYQTAYETLRGLRQDVVTTNRNYQLAFQQESEAPLYREYIELLLAPDKPSQTNLDQARKVATSLQVAELENFLRRPCIPTNLEQVDRTVDRVAATTAVIYPIVLSDRLEVIVKLPQEAELAYFDSDVSLERLQEVTRELQIDLEEEYTFDAIKTNAKLLYEWIIKPVRQQLKDKNVDMLVFALDGFLRSIPMSVLHDGTQYLIENYAIAVTPGLDLPSPSPIDRKHLKVLAVGLTDPPKNLIVNSVDVSANFAKLNNVNLEIDSIAAAGVSVTAIRDQDFTGGKFNQRINESRFPIVHMATHGQFSSDAKNTFLLTANGVIGVDQLSDLFKTRTEIRSDAIELLVLNACETAAGDPLAALGIAGAAFRAGARSVLASLWTLDDTSSAELTRRFYQQFTQSPITKAQALRQAQLDLLSNPQFEHPRYWATYVLVGNWL
ncbi:CHAT domain-containing protein [Leptolyngbya ohadii]|uniref:CHAT domain-containing protein n=1 Tax=Leptolyngbya ohadii TaxID=1962290 RepID=UPI000B5A0ED2|nr:CHAT domain-containing protein [Leptolyngbya ohadii]